jgi:hypothetical protein
MPVLPISGRALVAGDWLVAALDGWASTRLKKITVINIDKAYSSAKIQTVVLAAAVQLRRLNRRYSGDLSRDRKDPQRYLKEVILIMMGLLAGCSMLPTPTPEPTGRQPHCSQTCRCAGG